MSTFKNIFFLVICLLIGIGIGQAFLAWRRHAAGHNFEKHEGASVVTGIGDSPGQRGFTLQASDLPNLPGILTQSESLFATAVGIEYAPSVTRDQLSAAAKEAHRRHFKVLLLPPAHFAAENPYPKPLREIAADAQAAGVDILCISWLNADPDPEFWKKETAAIRQVFEGRLILAATPRIMPAVGCWEVADILGAIGPIDLPRRLSQANAALEAHDLRVAWNSALTSLESLAKVNTKPLALLQMNIPADAAFPPAHRQLAYESLLLETKGRAAITDVLLFNWSGQPDAPNHLEALLPKIREAWDPKKPKPVINEAVNEKLPAEATAAAK